MKIQPIYNNKILKKGLEFAADNSALFVATTSLILSTAARPLAIMATPKTDKENRQYAAAKSLASSAVGYLIMLCASIPLAKSIKKIDKNPTKYLKSETIKTLQAGEKSLSKSKRYHFATQLFKLGLGFIIAAPKSILTCALIPPFMSKIFDKDKQKSKNPTFTGLTHKIGKIIDTSVVKKLSNRFHNTNFELHMMALTDALATGTFISQTAKSKKIEQDRKKALMYNAGISTGLSIAGGYVLNKATQKPTEKFIHNFKKANINNPKLEKYVEGIRIAKPALILGGIYYIIIPILSTFLADKFDKNQNDY